MTADFAIIQLLLSTLLIGVTLNMGHLSVSPERLLAARCP